MGRRVGVFAIDPDALSEVHKHDGIKNVQLLELEFQEEIISRRHSTANGGQHILFLWDESRPIGTGLGNLPKGIEVKGEGGQIILPGSVLRNGRKWGMGNDAHPQRAPEWLLDVLSPHTASQHRPHTTGNGQWRPGYVMDRLEKAEAALRSAGKGERNEAAGRWAMPIGHIAAGGAFEGVLTVDQVRDRLMEAARANGAGAKYIGDVKRAFDNGLKEPAVPRGKPSAKPLERLVALNMAEIELKPIEWLWPERMAIGKVSGFAGDPDLGKSLLTLDLAARVTRGDYWPVNGGRAPLGNVVLLSAEDDPEDTYGPRLKAMGADLSRITTITMVEKTDPKGFRGFDLQADVERLEALARETKAKLIIIDPVSAYMGKPGKADTHQNSDVRAILAPLKMMAEETRCAVLLVSHLNKSGGTNAMVRVTGSLGFIAAPRAGYLVTKDESNGAAPGRRLGLPIKNNLSPVRTGFAYRIGTREVEGIGSLPIVEWEDRLVEMTADQALALKDRNQQQATNPAVDFPREYLSDGPREKRVVDEEAQERGITQKQLRSAREKIGVKSYRTKDFHAKSYWELPREPEQGNLDLDSPYITP
jgi:putative DNA primase/helicase